MKKRDEFLKTIEDMNPKYNMDSIARAYDVAADMHRGQIRKSGEPYLIHPMAVAEILAELGMDEDTIAAGLLHDVVEDTDYTNEKLAADFGENVALMVDGVTKLKNLKFESKEEKQAENLRKMFLAMSKDIRVPIIKLSDRLHNLRTINYMTHEKIIEKCKETIDIYTPLAARLGMYKMKMEMEDIAFKYLEPEAYFDLAEQISDKKAEREAAIEKVIEQITECLEGIGIDFEIYGRSKHFYSIHKKMVLQHKNLDEIFDLNAVRILVDSVRDCYAVLGFVHTMWTPIPGRFKDYIAMPKPNMYQSLHTTVVGNTGKPFEIQIRTYEMHRIAEYGIAAHWKYKEGSTGDMMNSDDMKLSWLRQALELQKEVNDSTEFVESLKMDLFSQQVFVFTPQGDVIELPAGATPLDFAFKIHTDIGCKCVGAKVNGKMVTIDHVLENGDIIEIVTNPNSVGPSIDWLKIAKSSGARNKIRQWLKKENKNDNVDRGKDNIDKYVRKKGMDPRELLKNAFINKAYKEMGFKNTDEMYAALSNGGNVLTRVFNLLSGYLKAQQEAQEAEKEKTLLENLREMSERTEKRLQNQNKKREEKSGVIVEGLDNLMIRIAHCCSPVPGDEIIGYITKGRGITVHRCDCDNLKSLSDEEKDRFIPVKWNVEDDESSTYSTELCVIAKDQKSMISSISKICDDMEVHIDGLNARAERDETVRITLTLGIKDKSQVEKICRSLKGVPGILEAYRAKS
ncbi:MAG: bifunctional (p)ppGpp synthetase/guanosine-3',5'-bis(diphosphate) 3'-pyrophosphohydrolase [Clostridiales bacterium]|nr:bifunctional (p)ppGpp synthetase/guanosine-3',5'-bis(diphosphate) 3'-pyrophosphohydrolase [Clostridiales bacterium]MDD7016368.1 bifunctional (p)ppGpp synthetase/guanosine-3',5'-bis(diphosphate) 3'-pyrophosphohydrolase [Bacillota bacterium]